MGKNELPHPKHRVAGTTAPPRSIAEASRDDNPVEFANQRAREALEQRKTEDETPPAPTRDGLEQAWDQAARATTDNPLEQTIEELEEEAVEEPDDATRAELEAERLEDAAREQSEPASETTTEESGS